MVRAIVDAVWQLAADMVLLWPQRWLASSAAVCGHCCGLLQHRALYLDTYLGPRAAAQFGLCASICESVLDSKTALWACLAGLLRRLHAFEQRSTHAISKTRFKASRLLFRAIVFAAAIHHCIQQK